MAQNILFDMSTSRQSYNNFSKHFCPDKYNDDSLLMLLIYHLPRTTYHMGSFMYVVILYNTEIFTRKIELRIFLQQNFWCQNFFAENNYFYRKRAKN